MKARVCPKCGKHNLKDAWNCIDCGETLSMKTLMDTDSGQFLSKALIEQEKAQAMYGYAAVLIKKGLSRPQIEDKLVEKGLDQQAAFVIVKKLATLRYEAQQKAARKNMLYGALWCIGGIIVTAVTYAAASGGGTYMVALGAIVFGAIQFFKGFSQYSG